MSYYVCTREKTALPLKGTNLYLAEEGYKNKSTISHIILQKKPQITQPISNSMYNNIGVKNLLV